MCVCVCVCVCVCINDYKSTSSHNLGRLLTLISNGP